jgi:hypothetical protein
MRVLHLIDERTCAASPVRAALLGDLVRHGTAAEHVVAVVGSGDAHAAAGLRPAAQWRPGLGWAPLAWRGLGRFLRQAGPFDWLQGWSPACDALVRLAPRSMGKVSSWTGAVGVDAARLAGGRRDALRRRWGVTPEACVVLLLGDEPDRTPAMGGLCVTGLAAETGRPIHLLTRPDARDLGRTARLEQALGRRRVVTDAWAAEPWIVAAGCDLALALGPRSDHRLSLAWAMAAGLAIVGETPSSPEALVRHEGTALLAPPNDRRRLAGQLVRLYEDGELRAALGERARRLAAERFDPSRFADQVETIYRGALDPPSVRRPRRPTRRVHPAAATR